MMYTELNYLIAQQHAAEARRTAERERLSRQVDTDRTAPVGTQRMGRLAAALRRRRLLAGPGPA